MKNNQTEQLLSLSVKLAQEIDDINTRFEPMSYAASFLIKANLNLVNPLLKQLESMITQDNSRKTMSQLEDIRDLYLEIENKSESIRLTDKYALPKMTMPTDSDSQIPEQMYQLWNKEMEGVIEKIENEEYLASKKVLKYAVNGDLVKAKNGLPFALSQLDNVLEVNLTKYHLLYNLGVLYLHKDSYNDARDIFDEAADCALYFSNSTDEAVHRITLIADVFCKKEMFFDAERVMALVPPGYGETCATHPYTLYLIPALIQNNQLAKATNFAKEINILSARNCSLDDLVTAYAEQGDVKEMLKLKSYFSEQDTWKWSFAFALIYLAEFQIKSGKEYTATELNSLTGLLI